MKRTLTTILVATLVFGMTLTAGLAGPVAADHADTNEDLLIHTNETASDDLSEIWVDVTGAESIATTDNTTTVTVTVEGINGSTVDELHNETLTIEEGNVSSSSYQLADSDSDDYDELRLTVEAATGEGQYINESETEWGTLVEQVGGGGGGFLSGSGALGGGVGALAILGVGWLLLKED